MERLFYSTGQVARQFGTTLAAVRTLCENRVIAAETSPGGHWRVSASEVERLKRDGLPPIPRPLPNRSTPPPENPPSYDHDYTEARMSQMKSRWPPRKWRSAEARSNGGRLNARSRKTKTGFATVDVAKQRRLLWNAKRPRSNKRRAGVKNGSRDGSSTRFAPYRSAPKGKWSRRFTGQYR